MNRHYLKSCLIQCQITNEIIRWQFMTITRNNNISFVNNLIIHSWFCSNMDVIIFKSRFTFIIAMQFFSMITMLQAIYVSLSLAQNRTNLQSVTDDNWVEHSRVNWWCRKLHLHEIKKNNGVEKKDTHCSSCKENLMFIIFTMKNIFIV